MTEYIHAHTSLQCGCSFHVYRFTIHSIVKYVFFDSLCMACLWKKVKRMAGI
jgi:hypothetical protein